MIDRIEILELAKIFGLRADIVEKDCVLGWLLAAINQHPSIKGQWIFKNQSGKVITAMLLRLVCKRASSIPLSPFIL